jgi:hypothetical protein
MTFEERNTWVYAVVTSVAYGAYLTIVLGRAQSTPLTEVPYVRVMLCTIGAAILASILGHIAVGIAWPRDCGKTDERDREIHRFGEYIGQSFVVIGGVAALGLSMAEVDHFWIANAIYLGFVLSALLGSAAKLVAYRRGLQLC